MGSGPKKQDYEATEAEKVNASVAKARADRFRQVYAPLLREMRDQSMTDDVGTTLRGRANADTMQALTSQPTYDSTQSTTAAGDMAQAYQGQLGVANQSALDIQNRMKTNVVGTAQGQQADASQGLAQAARISSSKALERARGKQEVRAARLGAAAQIGTAFILQGGENMKDGKTFLGGEKTG
jgi:hypothetical protein